MKKVVMFLITIVMLTASASAVDFYIDTAKFETDVPPTIVNGRTLIPLRAIFEALGATVEWDQSTKTAIAKKDGVEMTIQIDNLTSYINGKEYTLDVPAQLIHGRTMAPARFIVEALDCEVSWHSATQTVAITKELKGLDFYMSLSGDRSRYHFDETCNKGSDYFEIDLAWAMGLGLKPCEDCVLTSGYNIILPSETQMTNSMAENIMPGKPQKEGFNETTNNAYTVGDIILSIPSYYIQTKETDSSISFSAETGGTAVVLTIATDDYIYASVETEFDIPVSNFLESLTNPILLDSDDVQIGELPGKKITYMADFIYNSRTYKMYGATAFVADANHGTLTIIALSQLDNAMYNYLEDYDKIIQSATQVQQSPANTPTSGNNGIRTEFKEAMDACKAFFDEYVAFMIKYKNAPYSLDMLTDYMDYIETSTDLLETLNAIEASDLTAAEADYYVETMTYILNQMDVIMSMR